MLSAALLLLCNSLFLSLHLTGSAGSFPKPLSAARERECLERCAAGDLEARNILVEHNLRLVAHIIKKYYTQSTDQEDLISIGTIGLIKAVNTFRPDKGIKLATYAARCIENEILMYFRGQKKLQGEVSLNEALDTGPEGDALYLGDVVGEEDTMLEELQSKEDRRLLHQLLARELTPREADVLRRRYGLDGHLPQTQRQGAMCPALKKRRCTSWRRPCGTGDKRHLNNALTAVAEGCAGCMRKHSRGDRNSRNCTLFSIMNLL